MFADISGSSSEVAGGEVPEAMERWCYYGQG